MKYQCGDNIEGLYKADTLIRIFRTMCHTGNLPFDTSTEMGLQRRSLAKGKSCDLHDREDVFNPR
jgi:hypothetical protein